MKKDSFEIRLPLEYDGDDILKSLRKKGVKRPGKYIIERKSLDARKKPNLYWNLKITLEKDPPNFREISSTILDITYKKHDKKVVVVGSGPSGIFSGLVLLQAGYQVTLLERGSDVEKRDRDISDLLEHATFNPNSNFAFGEGGAGTFSDGKLTSRSKHINREKDYILATFINNGAPEEIFSMVHPHLGSDNLKIIVKNMREQFINLGGEILFDTTFLSMKEKDGSVNAVDTTRGEIECDYLLLGIGHSSFETYRELINSGLQFKPKNFAIGFRAEHHQEIINMAQWGQKSVPGLKAAEYRLTAKADDTSVFSFCMCPGGTIVPAAALPETSVVNGMSNYLRDGVYANAAVVASFSFDRLKGREVSPLETLDLLESLERSYYQATGGYSVPAMKIDDFIHNRESGNLGDTSYALGLTPYNLKELLPGNILSPLQTGLNNFSSKLKGYDTGTIMGLESKTSAPLQVVRSREGLCEGYSNLYMVGEGAGWAGGIISSAADGIKGALNIIERES